MYNFNSKYDIKCILKDKDIIFLFLYILIKLIKIYFSIIKLINCFQSKLIMLFNNLNKNLILALIRTYIISHNNLFRVYKLEII